MLLSKCVVRDSKKLKFIKEQVGSGLLCSLGIKKSLNKIPLICPFLFKDHKMNEIGNNFLLTGDIFMPEMHLRQPGFTYSTCGLFIKNMERIITFKETGDLQYIYQNKLDKACFYHDIAYGDFKDLARRTASDKILHDKQFNIAENSKYD